MPLKTINSSTICQNTICYDSIDSTQLEAWRILKNDKDLKNGIIIADYQTNGIGTHGRKWYKENKEDITFSIFLSTYSHISNLENITIRVAEIWTKIFKEKYNINLEIKNPNDLFLKR